MSGWLEAILSAAFVAGLASGAHCAAMCGGIVHAVCGRRGPGDRTRWSYVFAYNSGRIASYTIAGVLVAVLGQAGLALRGSDALRQMLPIVAGVSLIVLALCMADVRSVMAAVESAGSRIWRHLQPYSRWFLPVDSLPRALGLGLVWGWLPCGLVYAALVTAMGTADPLYGALVMLAFGLGTLVNLLVLSAWFSYASGRTRSRIARLLGAMLVGSIGIFGIVKATHALPAGDAICYGDRVVAGAAVHLVR
jgi:sulfite exporter TauE/SafE